jgi:hypothetical protein
MGKPSLADLGTWPGLASPGGVVKELLPHQNRVISERLQLADKVNKLEAFVMSKEVSKLPALEKGLLNLQLEYMAMYLRVLDMRVSRYTGAKRYTCHKEVLARPMNRGAYNALRGWEMPANESPEDEGFLVEYLDGGPGNHPDFAGYISWSPKTVFERSYKENTR